MRFNKTIMVNRYVKKRYKIMINELTAKRYCKDDISLIENYEQAVNDPINKWVIHHRRGTIYSKEGLIEIGEYYHRPAIELIFMLEEEHRIFHRTGKRHSENTKKKMSKANIGNHYRLGKGTKPILQYTKEGEFIKEWIGTREAEMVLGINHSNITKCCK